MAVAVVVQGVQEVALEDAQEVALVVANLVALEYVRIPVIIAAEDAKHLMRLKEDVQEDIALLAVISLMH